MQATKDRQQVKFRERPAGNDLKELCPAPRIILDCGAGNGWFAKSAFTIWPKAVVHSFEPAERFNQTLQPLNDRHHVHRVALSNKDGVATLWLTHNQESNSLLEFLPDSPLAKAHAVVGREDVQVCRLDSIITDGIENVDILKLDVQGAELDVLDGARELLKRAHPIVYAEVAFQQQYANQPLMDEVDEFMASVGYERLHLYTSPMPDIWGDAIYVPKAIRLNIGAGDTVIPGFTAIDRKLGTEAYPLNYPDGSVDEIRCVHMLEHLSYAEVPEALKEWHRVLKPGGRLRVSVPDVEKIATLASDESKFDPHWPYYLMGGQTDADDFHKSAYDGSRLAAYLEGAGFDNIQPWTSLNTDLAASDISLNLEGFKRQSRTQVAEVDMKVRAVIGLPRIGWNDSWQSIIDSVTALGIPIETHQGCFWWQNMQQALSRALKDGIDWVITLDYDSLVLKHHVQRLLEILGARPDIDAIAALQMRRGSETPLFSTGKTMAEFDGQPYRVNTAHFGLTVIRVAKLAKVPKPWLIDVPDDNGEFGGSHTDADITFWKKWTAAGNTVYVAPDVRIGHLELLVSEYDENYQPQHYHIGKWWNMHTKAGHCMRTTKDV